MCVCVRKPALIRNLVESLSFVGFVVGSTFVNFFRCVMNTDWGSCMNKCSHCGGVSYVHAFSFFSF